MSKIILYRDELCKLLSDEDLTDEKLREASEGLLPNVHDLLNSIIHSLTINGKFKTKKQILEHHFLIEKKKHSNIIMKHDATIYKAMEEYAFQFRTQSPKP